MTILVRAASLQGYEALARECGVDPIRAMQRVHLTPLHLADVDSLIPFTARIDLLEQTAAQSGCMDFGLRLAKVQGVGMLGQLAMLLLNAATLGEALQLASRYIFVHSPASRLEVVPVNSAPHLVDLTFAVDMPHRPQYAQTVELSVGLMVNGLLAGSQGTVKPEQVRLPHAQLGPSSSYRATMGCECVFHADAAAVRIEAGALQLALPANNPQMRQLAQDYLDQQFGDPAQHFADRIRSMVRRFLSSGMGNQAAIARALSINPRTLQRRLAAEGLYFEDIVDDIRKHQLLELLDQAQAPPLTQIAWMLGYTEASTLNRSCLRWYGCTPGTLRQRRNELL
jgi:AraC-like DNA-binding protein|nr:AraC family transcriptional regulator ligand-binding domain-containing protein [Rhodoferax sp.]